MSYGVVLSHRRVEWSATLDSHATASPPRQVAEHEHRADDGAGGAGGGSDGGKKGGTGGAGRKGGSKKRERGRPTPRTCAWSGALWVGYTSGRDRIQKSLISVAATIQVYPDPKTMSARYTTRDTDLCTVTRSRAP